MKIASQRKTRRPLTYICCCMILIIFSSMPSSIAVAQVNASSHCKRIGLVLGGGGAKGAAHIGVLRVLEELKIPVDCIAGTSMGAIIGALYASGLSADEIEGVITSINWEDVFSGEPERKYIDYRRKREDYQILSSISLGIKNRKILLPKGLIKDQKVNLLFETLMLHTAEIDDFDKLPIPFRAVAVDLETGEMVVLKNGSLADAARASMSIAGVFPPVELNGRILIDGGIVRNVPVDIVREMGADIIICVDVGKPLATRESLGSPVGIMNQMIDIMMKKNVREQIDSLGPNDIYVNPELGEFDTGDFKRVAEIIPLGELAARGKLESLARYSVSDAEYASFTSRHQRDLVKEVKISSVKIQIKGENRIPPEMVASRLSVKSGDIVDMEKLQKNAGIIYGMGDFERVDLQLKKQQDEYDLVVKGKEKSWGPNYLRFGLGLESDFEGSSSYTMLFDYTRRWVNNLGAEWKTQVNIGSPSRIYSEFYQPLTVSRLFFVLPYLQRKQEEYDAYIGDDREALYRITSYAGGIDLGYQPWIYGEARLGLQFSRLKAIPRVGNIGLPEDHIARGAILFNARVDQLDNVNFPNNGYLVQIETLSALESLGSDDEYSKFAAYVGGAFTFRKNTYLAMIALGSKINKELPFYDQYRLGGFHKLSGLNVDQLMGQSMAIGTVSAYHKIGDSFLGDMYLGASLETGNVWQEDEKRFDLGNLHLAGSLFIGYDTFFGPLYLAFGLTDGGYKAGYLYLGRMF